MKKRKILFVALVLMSFVPLKSKANIIDEFLRWWNDPAGKTSQHYRGW